jgi:hypothetical protein
MEHTLKKFLSSLVLASYITISFFGLFYIYQLSQHHIHHEAHCPFTSGQEMLCIMNLGNSVQTWQKSLSVPFIFLILFSIILVSHIYIPLRKFLKKTCFLYIKRHRFRVHVYMQTIFSQGILNPKVY